MENILKIVCLGRDILVKLPQVYTRFTKSIIVGLLKFSMMLDAFQNCIQIDCILNTVEMDETEDLMLFDIFC